MSILNFLIITAAFGVATDGSSTNESKAKAAIVKSLYIKNKVDRDVKRWEKKVTPQWLKDNGWIIVGMRIAQTKKISYHWSF